MKRLGVFLLCVVLLTPTGFGIFQSPQAEAATSKLDGKVLAKLGGRRGFLLLAHTTVWLEAIQALDGSLDRAAGVKAMNQLEIPTTDIMMPGVHYMSEAAGRGDPEARQ